MPRIKLTEKTIAKLHAPTASGKQIIHWDAELRGFGVLLSGISNSRTYVCQRDLPGGKTRRVTIAAVNEMSLAEAKDSAREMLVDMRKGDRPKAQGCRYAAGDVGCVPEANKEISRSEQQRFTPCWSAST